MPVIDGTVHRLSYCGFSNMVRRIGISIVSDALQACVSNISRIEHVTATGGFEMIDKCCCASENSALASIDHVVGRLLRADS